MPTPTNWRRSKQELEKERARLYEYADELRELGVELKDGLTGLVDFPSLHGRSRRLSLLEARRARSAALARTRRRLFGPAIRSTADGRRADGTGSATRAGSDDDA